MAVKRKGSTASPRTRRPQTSTSKASPAKATSKKPAPEAASEEEAGYVFGKTSLDVGALREIVGILEGTEVTRLSWTNGDEKLVIRRGPGPDRSTTVVHTAGAVSMPGMGLEALSAAAPAATPAPTAAAAAAPAATPAPEPVEKPGHLVTSPFVGTFYAAPAPDQDPFVQLNSNVRKGQVLCIVEAMKLMNEIEADAAGRVTEILVENGQPVEFGQPLFRIETA
jgi:acetyl-CoA carboxylase biotin carboxyl carrier protein